MKFQVISDGSCDLPQELTKEKRIHVVPFYVSFDAVKYYKEMEEMPVRRFYEQMVSNPKVFPKSSLPSVEDYVEAFRPYAKEGMPVLCICITVKFSGSYNSACTAKELILEEYPSAQIEVMDSMMDTVLQGIFVLEAAKMCEAGFSLEETVKCLKERRESGRILFTIGSIDYLQHGGRIGKLAGLAGSVLGIKPLIVLKEGEIFSTGITRSREKGKAKLIAQTKDHFEAIKERPENYSITVGYGYDYEEAVGFRDALLASMREYADIKDIPIFQIGATIAVHTGPYPIGLGLVRKYDR